ncbi:hypothetical protein B566_EDAN003079 [Ephemera danica]|nr:hypothetical protein B566_EDAN003079 [Ephemera danica]
MEQLVVTRHHVLKTSEAGLVEVRFAREKKCPASHAVVMVTASAASPRRQQAIITLVVHMAHALRRISYATCDPESALFSFLAREPKGHFSLQYCHSFRARSPEQTDYRGTGSIMAVAASPGLSAAAIQEHSALYYLSLEIIIACCSFYGSLDFFFIPEAAAAVPPLSYLGGHGEQEAAAAAQAVGI